MREALDLIKMVHAEGPKLELEKGDKVGHPFHGNQYKGGAGAHAADLRAEGKSRGGEDAEDFNSLAEDLEAGNLASAGRTLGLMDTEPREAAFVHIPPSAWAGMGVTPVNPQKAKESYESRHPVKKTDETKGLEKGEKAGHPFRGNQYGAGKSGGGAGATPAAQKVVDRFNRSKGNFADNMAEMGVEDIETAHGLSKPEAEYVYSQVQEKIGAGKGGSGGVSAVNNGQAASVTAESIRHELNQRDLQLRMEAAGVGLNQLADKAPLREQKRAAEKYRTAKEDLALASHGPHASSAVMGSIQARSATEAAPRGALLITTVRPPRLTLLPLATGTPPRLTPLPVPNFVPRPPSAPKGIAGNLTSTTGTPSHD